VKHNLTHYIILIILITYIIKNNKKKLTLFLSIYIRGGKQGQQGQQAKYILFSGHFLPIIRQGLFAVLDIINLSGIIKTS